MMNVIVVNVVAPLKVSLSERLIRQEGLQQNKKNSEIFFLKKFRKTRHKLNKYRNTQHNDN